jgi:hypothetical protein
MLVLAPEVVRFEDAVFEDALAVSVDRAAERLVEEWGDDGPHCAMADVTRTRTLVKVVRRPARSGADETGLLRLGREGELVFYTSGGTDAGRVRVVVRCVLSGVKTELSLDAPGRATGSPARGLSAVQTLTFVGVSIDGGASDPVSLSDSGV